MKKIWSLLTFLAVVMPSFAQTRGDIRVYIPPVEAAPNQAVFFRENFTMELAAAGYSVAGNQSEADYNLMLGVKPNVILYDDGTEEPAPPGEKQFNFQIALFRTGDNAEIITFSFPFTELSEMYNYNSYLLHEVMANVPLPKPDNDALTNEVIIKEVVVRDVVKEVVIEKPSEQWRNKWLYLRASIDYPVITTFLLKPDGLYGGAAIYSGDQNYPDRYLSLDHRVRAVPGGTLGFELQFLNWMSTEVNFEFRIGDPIKNYAFVPGIGLQIKFPIKPSSLFMLEPYAAATYSVGKADYYDSIPWLGAGGGLQFGVKGGESGALFFDVNFIYSIGDVVSKNTNKDFPEPDLIHWNRYIVGIGIGYKLGFSDRTR
jgi:hypothetical protein